MKKFNPITRQMEDVKTFASDRGEQGAQGIQGIQGIKGDKGDIGPMGLRGPQGERGFQGDKGSKGDKGDTGERGPQGLQGLKGDIGERGEKGESGKQGQIGLKGENGKDGTEIYYTSKVPNNNLGLDGEWCFNALREIFHKEAGKWIFYGQIGGNGISKIRNITDIGNVKLTNLTIGDNLQWNGLYWSNSQEDSMANQNVQLDVVDASVTYIGYAEAGSLTNAAAWKIKKITTTGDDIAITWADGNVLYDNIWNNRASLTYS